MPDETLYPTAQITWTSLSGSYTDVDGEHDGVWATASSNTSDITAYVSFGTPSYTLDTVGGSTQVFRAWVRHTPGQTGVPVYTIYLYENGNQLATLASSQGVNSDTGEEISVTWDASQLSNSDGSGVEFYILGTHVGGSPSTRAAIDIDSIAWDVTFASGDTTIDLTGLAVVGAASVPAPQISIGTVAGSSPVSGSSVMPVPGHLPVIAPAACTSTIPAVNILELSGYVGAGGSTGVKGTWSSLANAEGSGTGTYASGTGA